MVTSYRVEMGGMQRRENAAVDDKRKRLRVMQLGLQPTSSDLIDFACNKSEYQHKSNIKSVYNVAF